MTIERLLSHIAFKIHTLRAAQQLVADQLAPNFRIFDYLRRDELGVSQVLAGLLDPRNSHGQGDLFLKSFLALLPVSATQWAEHARLHRVEREMQTREGRSIDIVLEYDVGLIGIENKPWAVDGNFQLADYASYLEARAVHGNWLLIYLSNHEPSVHSIAKVRRLGLAEAGHYVALTFSEVAEWLSSCATKSKALQVRLFVDEFSKFIQSEVNGELNMSEEATTREIILSPDSGNLESAFHIVKGLPSVKRHLLHKLHDDLRENLPATYLLSWDQKLEAMGSYAGFRIKFSSDQDKSLAFEFQRGGLDVLIWGIQNDSKSNKNAPWVSGIRRQMNILCEGRPSAPWWPWWQHLDKPIFDLNLNNWGVNHEPWQMILDGSLAARICKLAAEVDCTLFPGDMRSLLKPQPQHAAPNI